MTIFIFLLQVRPESFQILSCMSCLKLFRILHTSHASLRFSYLNNRWKPWSNGYGRRLTLGSNPSPDGHFVTSICYKKLYCFFNKIPTKKERQFLNNITFLVLKICTNGTNCFWMAEYCEFFMRQSVTDVRHDILYFIPFSGEFRSSLIETLIHQMPFECCNQCMFPTFN